MLAGNKSGALERQLHLKSDSIQDEWTVPTKVLSGSCWESEEESMASLRSKVTLVTAALSPAYLLRRRKQNMP